MAGARTQTSPPPVQPYFRAEALRFLRGLKRNNRREWFEERRPVFEQELKAPMLALIETVTQGMVDYAQDHIREARRILLRIYRDTRFSSDKTPYKQHIAGWWGAGGMEKTSGAGYYFHLSSTQLEVAAGVFMPTKEQMLGIRRHLAEHHEEFRALLENRKLRKRMQLHEARSLSRVPKGFAADHPAAEWLRWQQWGVAAALPVEAALDPRLPQRVREHFEVAAPLVDFLQRGVRTGEARGQHRGAGKVRMALY